MRVPVYLRIAKKAKPKGSFKVSATSKVCDEPLYTTEYRKRALPTIWFGVEFDIPDDCFKKAGTFIALINVAESEAKIATKILTP